jgi:hypothetical protein
LRENGAKEIGKGLAKKALSSSGAIVTPEIEVVDSGQYLQALLSKTTIGMVKT